MWVGERGRGNTAIPKLPVRSFDRVSSLRLLSPGTCGLSRRRLWWSVAWELGLKTWPRPRENASTSRITASGPSNANVDDEGKNIDGATSLLETRGASISTKRLGGILNYNHWHWHWNDGSFRGTPSPISMSWGEKDKTWTTFQQTFAAAILNVKSTLNGGGGRGAVECWI